MAGDGEEVKKDKKGKKDKCMASLKGVGTFIWNSETKECLGRTGSSWGLIGLFYLVFYAGLAGLFAICLSVFMATLDDFAPTQKGFYSPLKQNPGMGFRPQPSVEETMIVFTRGEPDTYKDYIKNIDATLNEYSHQAGGNVVDCSAEGSSPSPEDKEVCQFQMSALGTACTNYTEYGFAEGRPCVLLKINKIYNWVPHPFDNESLSDPNNEVAVGAKEALGDRLHPDYIGVSCDGEAEGDRDNVLNVTYYPNNGFPRVFYPFLGQPNFFAPLVMVQFDVRLGTVVFIHCKIWTKDIRHHQTDRQGGVHFELLVDKHDKNDTIN